MARLNSPELFGWLEPAALYFSLEFNRTMGPTLAMCSVGYYENKFSGARLQQCRLRVSERFHDIEFLPRPERIEFDRPLEAANASAAISCLDEREFNLLNQNIERCEAGDFELCTIVDPTEVDEKVHSLPFFLDLVLKTPQTPGHNRLHARSYENTDRQPHVYPIVRAQTQIRRCKQPREKWKPRVPHCPGV